MKRGTILYLIGITGVIWLVWLLYAPAVGYGLIWDDPQWFGRVIGRSPGELIRPNPTFQFYRPGTLLYNRLFIRPDDTVNAPLLHLANLAWHTLNIAVLTTLSRRLGLRRVTAVLVAAVFAVFPFAQQAVAWAATQQPLALLLQNGAWLAFLAARQAPAPRRGAAALSLGLFALALTVQESTVALAVLPMGLVTLLPQRTGGRRGVLPWLYLLPAAAFALVWAQAPRAPGITTLGWRPAVAGYLAQGVLYPLIGRPRGYPAELVVAPQSVVAAAVALTVVLFALAAWHARGRVALVGIAWAGLGMAPALVGLDFGYVSLAPRLLYYVAPGVGLLWVAALAAGPVRIGRIVFRRQRPGVVVVLIILSQSIWLVHNMQTMLAHGVAHMDELLAAVARERDAGVERLLFVNFPDQYRLRRAPFPVGYWGWPLAPVAMALEQFPESVTGYRPQTESVALPWIDEATRAAGPYAVDLRGVIVPPERLFDLAMQVEVVYLTRYRTDGTFALERVGRLVAESAETCAARPGSLARLGSAVCLHAASVSRDADQLHVRAVWSLDGPIAPAEPFQTFFVHLGYPGQPPLSQADGDAWSGLLPVTAWRPGYLIEDERRLANPSAGTSLTLGLYDWVSGARLPATTPDGRALPDGAVPLPLPVSGPAAPAAGQDSR